MSCRNTIFITLLVLLLVSGFASLKGQDTEKIIKQDFPVSISLTSHSWAFPMMDVFRFKPYYPGFAFGTEFYYLKREKSRLFQTAEIGGFLNNASGSALYLNSNFGFRYTFKFGLMTDASLGIGYFHGFHRSKTYQQNAEGEYSEVPDWGIPSSSGNMAISLGYDLSEFSNLNMVLFLRYQWIAGTHYWSMIGIRPNGLLHLGIRKPIRQ